MLLSSTPDADFFQGLFDNFLGLLAHRVHRWSGIPFPFPDTIFVAGAVAVGIGPSGFIQQGGSLLQVVGELGVGGTELVLEPPGKLGGGLARLAIKLLGNGFPVDGQASGLTHLGIA
jgi:hypothetical protein